MAQDAEHSAASFTARCELLSECLEVAGNLDAEALRAEWKLEGTRLDLFVDEGQTLLARLSSDGTGSAP